MNFLDKFRYTYDDLNELGIVQNNKNDTKNFNNQNLRNLLSSSVKVSENLFPKIASSIDNVFDRLGVKNNFNFFITANHIQTQAACAMMPQSLNAEIIITSKMVELLNPGELESVIAHEISHFYYQHSLYPPIEKARTRTEYLNFLNLSRAAEISADRAGLLGSGSIENSLRAMLKISTGLNDEHISFNFSSYLDQLRELKGLQGNSNLLYATHPTFLNRMQALIWFSMTREYHQFFDTKKKGSYNISEIDKKIEGSIKKIIGNEVDVSNKEIFDKALLWGSLNLYLSDKKFSKAEQEIFIKKFGKEKATKAISLLKISNRDMLEKKVETSFTDASNLLKTDKNILISELKKIGEDMEGNKIKKLETLGRLLSFLGHDKPVT